MPEVVTTRADLRAALRGAAPGLVPTMGALHGGHAALIARSADENSCTVVTIFVNPSQFGDPADLAAYPRDLKRDVDAAGSNGADLIFAPPVEEVYPPGFATTVAVGGVAEPWEGEFRPGHFRGVATVVAVLLNQVRPARAYFGEKDFQQLAVIRRLHADLALPGEIIACPTVRDEDGLALSSRNVRLTAEERRQAANIPRALFRMVELVRQGEHDAARLLAHGHRILGESPALTVEYLAIVDGATLAPIDLVGPGARAILAARLGDVRLIDNVALDLDEGLGR